MNEDAVESKITTDRETIRNWADERNLEPVRRTTAGTEEPSVRLVHDAETGRSGHEEVSWDEFFDRFEDEQLAFMYQEFDSVDDEVEFAEVIDRTSIDDEIVQGETVETEVVRTRVVETEVVEKETVESEVVDSEIIGSNVLDTELVGRELVDCRLVEDETATDAGGGTMDTDAGGDAMDTDTVGGETAIGAFVENEVLETYRIRSEAFEREYIQSEVVDTDTTAEETVESDTTEAHTTSGDERLVDSDDVEEEVTDRETMETETVTRERIEGEPTERSAVQRKIIESEVTETKLVTADLRDAEVIDTDVVTSEVTESELVEEETIDVESLETPSETDHEHMTGIVDTTPEIGRGRTDEGTTAGGTTTSTAMDEGSRDATERVELTPDDEGKRVVDSDGERIGTVDAVEGDDILVEPHDSITDRIKSVFGEGHENQDEYRIGQERITEVTGSTVRVDTR
ncbi:hypothetical protein [Halomicrococcus sp. SG-WS-1]|uniref:hypothetical protein n=1 Tax=Halomicrococcus sp. SG-WS-1 TaxID=3439057 RepID=UPI003F790DF5